ncbi:hypothetical protein BJL90_08240 [Clostridium formicaceticum]|uniref:SLH domain-containing protein n=1 Tax=Clostridium formicaceticum TaxID=1497 RepID=A0ABM6ESD7_9CLOT|nr:S-layer homology domain-containing protein [Clostridium formicaceticum]AOY75883.1 hypothetical protein BJL90_08240 [Clostridium formicaceticum]
MSKNRRKILSFLMICIILFSSLGIGNSGPSFAEELGDSPKRTVIKSVYEKDILQETAIIALEENPLNIRDRLETALPDTVDFVLQDAYSMDWVVSGLARLENYRHKIPLDYVESRVPIVQNLAQQQDAGNRNFKITDFQRMTLGIVAAGGGPRDVGGIDLIERIYNPISKTNSIEYITRQGINAVIFALIAVDTRDYEIPQDAIWTRERMIQEILSNEITAANGTVGGWALYGSVPDPDITGMAMIALGPYRDSNPQVRAAVERGANVLSSLQIDEGEFAGGYHSWGTVNVESCVQVVMGLTANNIDPFSEKFVKNGKTIADAILKFKVTGGFAHSFEASPGSTPGQANGMASEQALYGIAQLFYYMDGNQGSIFRWGNETPPINKTRLEEKLAEAKAIEKDNYTEASYENLQRAIAQAEAILIKADVTQEEVNQETQFLIEAMKTLVYLVHKITAVPDNEGKIIFTEEEIKHALVEIVVPENAVFLQVSIPKDNESTKIILHNKVLPFMKTERRDEAGNLISFTVEQGTEITNGIYTMELLKIIKKAEILKIVEEDINQLFQGTSKKVKTISDYIVIGSAEQSVTLDQHASISIETNDKKQAAYRDHLGNISILPDVVNEEEGEAKQLNAYTYFNESAMVIRSNDLSSFVLFDVEGTTDDSTDPKPPTEEYDKMITASIRIEGYDQTVVPMRSISTKVFDLNEYLGPASGSSATPSSGWGKERFPNGATVAHATVEALEQAGAYYDFQDYGWALYIAMINGDREFDYRSTSGWMYRVNGVLPNFGSQEYVLSDGDVIEWYFGAYGFETLFTAMEADKISAKTGEEVTVTLIGEKTDLSGGSGVGATIRSKVANAQIYVNGEPYKENEADVYTDSEGKATLKFLSAGNYTISAERTNKEGLKDIVRPIGVVVNITGETIASTIITIENNKYKEEFDIIVNSQSTEESIRKALESAYEKLLEAAKEMWADEDALQVASEIKDVLNLMKLAVDRIAKEESISFFIELQVKIMEILIESLEKATEEETIEKIISMVEEEALDLIKKVIEKADDLEKTIQLFVSIANTWNQIRSVVGSLDREETHKKIMELSRQVIKELTVLYLEEGDIEIGEGISKKRLNEEQIMSRAKQFKNHLGDINKAMMKIDAKDFKRKIMNYLVINLPMEEGEVSEIEISRQLLREIQEEIFALKIVDQKATMEIKTDAFAGGKDADHEITIRIVKTGETIKITSSEELQQPIKVTIPYDLKENKGDNTAVMIVTDDGENINVGGKYDEDHKTITFLTNKVGKIDIEVVKKQFQDLNGFEWAQKDIEKMASKGMISGKSSTSFDPSGNLTRAEFAALMFKILRYQASVGGDVEFSDVLEEDWYYTTVVTVVDQGLMSGKSKTSFDPNGYITNQELAVVLSKILLSHGFIQGNTKVLEEFKDAEKIDQWAVDDVGILVENRILLEKENFNSQTPVNRAEAIYMVSRLYDVIMY